MSKLTIRDVAHRAGVSLGTASRALNDVAGVHKETHEKVRRAAEELGWRPNRAARALRSQRSGIIGCLFSDIENPLYARLFGSLQDRLADEGLVTLIATTGNRLDRERRTVGSFVEHGIDAAIVAPGNEHDPELTRMLSEFPGPLVIVDRDLSCPGDSIFFDHAEAMQMAVTYLAGLGHSRIAPAFTHFASRPGRLRDAAFRAAVADAGLSDPAPLSIVPETPNASVYERTVEVFSRPDRPTALIAQGTRVLSSALNALSRLALNVPQDVSVISIGDSALTAEHVPPVTALALDHAELVDAVVTPLLARLKGEAASTLHKTLHYRLIHRGSCAAYGDRTEPKVLRMHDSKL